MRSSHISLLAATIAATATAQTSIGNGAEWGGVFPTPLNSYIWSAEQVNGAYADPTMTLVAVPASAATTAVLNTLDASVAVAAYALSSCTVVTNGGTITPSATPACYTLTFDTTASQTTFTVDTSGASNVAFFGQHFPIEFEATTHYFYDSANTDVEPVAELPLTSIATGVAEWGGVFPTPLNSYIWSAEQVNGAYADPTMTLVAVPASAATAAVLSQLDHEVAWAAYQLSSCTVVTNGGTITPSATPACYTLTFDTTVSQTTFTVDTTSASNVAFFGQHHPIEFEATTHYFYDSANTDVEPVAELPVAGGGGHSHSHGGTQESCGCAQFEADHPFTIDCSNTAAIRAAGTTLAACGGGTPSASVCSAVVATAPACQTAFFMIQAHHDWCLHDTLTQAEETLFHDWEAACLGCQINRQYQANLANCIVPDCNRPTLAETGHFVLNSSCTANGGAGSCCHNPMTQGAFQTVVAYHDLCEYNQVPYYIETDFHDYEEACEDHFCNAIPSTYDGRVCQSPPTPPNPPPPPTWPQSSSSSDNDLEPAVLAAIVAAAGLAVVFFGFVICLITQERAGSPVFSKIARPAISQAPVV